MEKYYTILYLFFLKFYLFELEANPAIFAMFRKGFRLVHFEARQINCF